MMKKFIFSLLGIAALTAAFSCKKEMDALTAEPVPGSEQVNPETLPDNIPASITASFQDTKTSYDNDGKFSWVSGENGDRVYLMFYNASNSTQGWVEYKAGSTTADGKAVFEIVSGQSERIAALEGYTNSGIAVYGKGSGNHVARPYSSYTEAYSLYEPGTHTASAVPFLTLQRNLTGDGSEVVLLGAGTGSTDESAGTYSDYHFYTACAVLKVTVSGIPESAKELRLSTSDKVNYPLNGDFIISRITDPSAPLEITSSSYRQYLSSSNYYDSSSDYVAAAWDGTSTTQTFYFNIPTGTYPANTLSIRLVDTAGNELLKKTITAEYTFNRNDLVPASFANEWITLGTAHFYDKGPNKNWDTYYHAEVPVQKNALVAGQYRLVNPYGTYKSANNNTDAATPDNFLVFTVDSSTDLVTFEKHATGLVLNSNPIVIQHPTVDGKWDGNKTGTAAYNKVWQKDAEGNPLVVQLAPFYCFSNNSNGWSRNNYNHCIEILFPGYAPTDVEIASSSLASSQDVTITVSGTNVATAKASCNRYASFSSMSAVFNATEGTTFSGFEGTGVYTRQFAIQAYNTDGTEIYHNYIEKIVYSVKDETLAGTYKFNVAYGLTHYSRSAWVDISADSYGNKMVISVSDNVFKGNLMITDFFGFGCDGTTNSGIVNGPFNGVNSDINGTYSSGTACYGIYNSSTLSFSDADQSPFMHYDGTGVQHLTQIGPDIYIQDQDGNAESFAFTVDTTDGVVLTKTTNNGLVLHFSPTDNRGGDKCILTLVGASTGAHAQLKATKQ